MRAPGTWFRSSVGGALVAALATVWCAGSVFAASTYVARVDEPLSKLNVRACFDDAVPRRLVAGGDLARAALRGATAQPRGGISLAGLRRGDCIEYAVDLELLRRAYSQGRTQPRSADLLTRSGDWLWLDPAAQRAPVDLSFELPAGISVSAPWIPLAAPERPAFRIGQAPLEWEDHVAFGRFQVERLRIPGAELRLAILDATLPDAPRAAEVQALRQWLTNAGTAVSTLYGRFPLSSVQVLLLPRARGGRTAIPYGQVARGGAPAVLFFVDSTAPARSLREDWTGVHELSHLLLPYIRRSDAWASEGFASYFQNVLRARAGLLTPQQAWERLEAGFERGRRATRSGSLTDASRDMRRSGQLMRVYWAGAAIALRLDVELRRSSDGRQSLDTILAALAQCCLPSDQNWSAQELFTRFDQLGATTVAGTLHDTLVPATSFPDLQSTYRQLGLRFRDGRVSFDPEAPLAQVRTAIMNLRKVNP